MKIQRFLLTIFLFFAMINSSQCVDPNAAGGGIASCNPINGVDSSIEMDYEDQANQFGMDAMSIPVTIAKNTDGVDATSVSFQEISSGPLLKKFNNKIEKLVSYNVGTFHFSRLNNKCGKILVLDAEAKTIKILNAQSTPNCEFALEINDDMVGVPFALLATDEENIIDNIEVSAPVFVQVNQATALMNRFTYNVFITGVDSDVWNSDLISFSDPDIYDLVEIQEKKMAFMNIENDFSGEIESHVIFPVLYDDGSAALWALPTQGGYPFHFIGIDMVSQNMVSSPEEMHFFDIDENFYRLDQYGILTELDLKTTLPFTKFVIHPSGDYILYATKIINPLTDNPTIIPVLYDTISEEHIQITLEELDIDFVSLEFDWANYNQMLMHGTTQDKQHVVISANLGEIIDGYETRVSEWAIIKTNTTFLMNPIVGPGKVYYLCRNPDTSRKSICEVDISTDENRVIVTLPMLDIDLFRISYDRESYLIFQTSSDAPNGNFVLPMIGIYDIEDDHHNFLTIGHAPEPSNQDLNIVAYRYLLQAGGSVQMGILNLNNDSIATPEPIRFFPQEITVGRYQTVSLRVFGGRQPYSFSKVSGPGMLNVNTGHFRSTNQSGTAVVRVTDNLGNTAEVTITIAPPGTLDNTFNDIGENKIPNTHGEFTSATVTQNGIITAVGYSQGGMLVAKFDTEGKLDNTFNGTGKDIFQIGNDNNSRATDIVLSPQGSSFISGVASHNGNNDFALLKLLPLGQEDPSFDDNGKMTIDFLGGNDGANSVVVQSTGKIILGGYMTQGANMNFALARVNPDGELDNTFGPFENGTLVIPVAPAQNPDRIIDMVLLPNDEIAILGEAMIGGTNRVVLMKLNANGTVNSTFGVNGKVILDLNNQNASPTKLVYKNAKLYVSGSVFNSARNKHEMFVARLTLNGTLDNSFGNYGIFLKRAPNSKHSIFAYALDVEESGKIVVGGTFGIASNPNYRFLLRLTSEGVIQTSYGNYGYVTFTHPDPAISRIYDVVSYTDQRMIFVGYIKIGTHYYPLAGRVWH